MARKMMAPKARYLGTEDERAEIAVKYMHGKLLTLDECSKVMGLSRSAIKAIESRALAKYLIMLKKIYGKDIKLSDFVNTAGGRQSATMIQIEDTD